tara:strand:- start:1259 stop:2068 length:810 start_codon:yes stop_codon:yes gene_type:complete
MSNKKKFSSFKDQQMLVEGFRNFVAESEQDLPEEESYSEISEEADRPPPGAGPWDWGKIKKDRDKKEYPGMSMEKPAELEKLRKPKKVTSTIQAYKEMGNMLAQKGHDVPKGHRGRLGYINGILKKAGKSYKNKDWKNYDGMQAVLAQVVGAHQRVAAPMSSKAKMSKPDRVATGTPPKAIDKGRSGFGGDINADDIRDRTGKKGKEGNFNAFKGVGDFFKRAKKRGSLFEDKEYAELIRMIAESLSKHESFKKLFEEKSLKFKKKDVK